MYIESLEIDGFLDRERTQLSFQKDLNIITGYNGAGKTNLLKLIWYTLSGNINQLLKEVTFKDYTLKTSEYIVHITKVKEDTCRGYFESDGKRVEIEDEFDPESDYVEDARERFSNMLQRKGGSLFFPTFRRIEGGFSIEVEEGSRGLGSRSLFNHGMRHNDVQEALLGVSRRLSNGPHTFVTSISTVDIAELLLKRYTEMSEIGSRLQAKMSQSVFESIRQFRSEVTDENLDQTARALSVLEEISTLIETTDRRRERAMAPLQAVQNLATKIFRHKGIQLNRRVSFGDTANAINSDQLSAGEKQMLSFICYNAFTEDSPIFIDEPELSLHVDWQRTLFPTLQSQGKNNQFIIATHSPFIYGKYPEKEIALVGYRGDEQADG